MNERLFYLCGVHGAGKTTVLRRLLSQYEVGAAGRLALEIQVREPLERAILRAAKYNLEFRRHQAALAGETHAVLVGDRCIHDTLAYLPAYEALGWLRGSDCDQVRAFVNALFRCTGWPDRVIFLAPTVEQAHARLKVRCQDEFRWRQDDRNYLCAAIASFEDYFGKLARRSGVVVKRVVPQDVEVAVCEVVDFISKSRGKPLAPRATCQVPLVESRGPDCR